MQAAAQSPTSVPPLPIAVPRDAQGIWLDGDFKDTASIGDLELEEGEHSLSVVTAAGRVYASSFEVVRGDRGLSIAAASYAGPDVLRGPVHQRTLEVMPSEGAISGDFLVLRAGNRLLVHDVYDLRQQRAVEVSGLVQGPVVSDGEVLVVTKEKETSSGRGGSSTQTYHRVLRFEPMSGGLTTVSKRLSTSAVVRITSGRALVIDGRNASVRSAGDWIKTPIPKELARGATWTSSVATGGWLVASSKNGDVIGIQMPEPARHWTVGIGDSLVGLVACGELIAVQTRDEILGIAADSGRIAWRRPAGAGADLACLPARLHVLQPDGILENLARIDGAVTRHDLGRRGIEGEAGFRPVGNELLFRDVAGGLVLIDSELGFPLVYTGALGSPIAGAWATDGVLVLLTQSSRLLNFPIPGRREVERVLSTRDASLGGEPLPPGDAVLAPAVWLDGQAERGFRVDPANQAPEGASVASSLPHANGQVWIARGSVDIAVEPRDSYVWDNGIYLGRTPGIFRGLRPGDHAFHLVHPDRRSLVRSMRIDAEAPAQRVEAQLDTGRESVLTVTADLPGSRILIDGEFKGFSPLPFPVYNLEAGRVVEVEVRRFAFRTVRTKLLLHAGSEQFAARQEWAPPLFRLFVGAGQQPRTPLGWANDRILAPGTVDGPPISAGGGSALLGTLSLDAPLGRVVPFGRITATGDGAESWDVGLRGRLLRARKTGWLDVAVSLNGNPGDDSDPPCKRNERGDCRQGSDSNAPLELWEHPIERVRVDNSTRTYLRFTLGYRPTPRSFAEVSWANLRSARLRGTALVDGEGGHLVESDRAYDVSPVGGRKIEVRLQLSPTALLRTTRWPKSLAVELAATDSMLRFAGGDVHDQGISVALGAVSFWH